MREGKKGSNIETLEIKKRAEMFSLPLSLSLSLPFQTARHVPQYSLKSKLQ